MLNPHTGLSNLVLFRQIHMSPAVLSQIKGGPKGTAKVDEEGPQEEQEVSQTQAGPFTSARPTTLKHPRSQWQHMIYAFNSLKGGLTKPTKGVYAIY